MALNLIKNYIHVIVFAIIIHGVASNKIKYLESISVGESDLPSPEDVPLYLNVLEKILNYCDGNIKVLKPQFVFGLFLLNVNLRPFVSDKGLPISIRNNLKLLIEKSDKIQLEHNIMWLSEDKPNPIHTLATDDSAWSRRIKQLTLKSMVKPFSTTLYISWELYRRAVDETSLYTSWETYRRAVDDFENGVPSPPQSDVCLMRLAESDENISNYPLRCEIPADCYAALSFGTNVGYSLTHRLILLLFARLSRGCTIFSIDQDERLRNYLCVMAFNEAQYNAMYGFQIVDLFFEQTTLCTLDGHAQFLQKNWLTSLLRSQNELGCFNSINNADNLKNSLDTFGCTLHTTAVAAATYAGAVRFILENYSMSF